MAQMSIKTRENIHNSICTVFLILISIYPSLIALMMISKLFGHLQSCLHILHDTNAGGHFNHPTEWKKFSGMKVNDCNMIYVFSVSNVRKFGSNQLDEFWFFSRSNNFIAVFLPKTYFSIIIYNDYLLRSNFILLHRMNMPKLNNFIKP